MKNILGWSRANFCFLATLFGRAGCSLLRRHNSTFLKYPRIFHLLFQKSSLSGVRQRNCFRKENDEERSLRRHEISNFKFQRITFPPDTKTLSKSDRRHFGILQTRQPRRALFEDQMFRNFITRLEFGGRSRAFSGLSDKLN